MQLPGHYSRTLSGGTEKCVMSRPRCLPSERADDSLEDCHVYLFFPACPKEKQIQTVFISNELKQSRKQFGLIYMEAEVSRVLMWRTTPQRLLAPEGYEDPSKN